MLRYRRSAVCALVLVAAGVLAAGHLRGQTGAEPAPLRKGEVAGLLVYSDGKPAGLLPLVMRHSARPEVVQKASTDARGAFRFKNVAPGTYRLFELRAYLDARTGKCEVLERRKLKITGKDMLDERYEPDADTYWKPYDRQQDQKQSLERQF